MTNGYNKSIYTKGTTEFIDLDMSMLPNPSTGDLRMKKDAESIQQSLKNLLFTNFGERPLRPGIYSGLQDLLFEPLDQFTTIELDRAVRGVITNYEPRVKIHSLNFKDSPDQNSLDITLHYSIINNDTVEKITVLLKRTR